MKTWKSFAGGSCQFRVMANPKAYNCFLNSSLRKRSSSLGILLGWATPCFFNFFCNLSDEIRLLPRQAYYYRHKMGWNWFYKAGKLGALLIYGTLNSFRPHVCPLCSTSRFWFAFSLYLVISMVVVSPFLNILFSYGFFQGVHP